MANIKNVSRILKAKQVNHGIIV